MAIPMESDPTKSIWIEFKAQPPQSPFDRDAVKLDPDHNIVLFENDRVRVVRVHFGSAKKALSSTSVPRVIILLNDMHAESPATKAARHSARRQSRRNSVEPGRQPGHHESQRNETRQCCRRNKRKVSSALSGENPALICAQPSSQLAHSFCDNKL